MEKRIYELNTHGHSIAALGFNEDKLGVPLIFMHGALVSVNFWQPVMTPLINQKFRWYSLGLPAHFPSLSPPNFHCSDSNTESFYEIMFHAVEQLIGFQPCILIGHSTGGFAALNIAAREPERVKSIISIAGFAIGKWGGLEGLLIQLSRQGVLGKLLAKSTLNIAKQSELLYRYASFPLSANWLTYLKHPNLKPTFQAIYPDVVRFNLDALCELFCGIGNIDITSLLSEIRTPTLLISGDKDPVIPFEHTKTMADLIPHSELAVIKDAGHMLFFERPSTYHKLVTDWITKEVRS